MVKTMDAGLLPARYRVTKQRAAVLRVLDGGGHLSAETILERVRSELPGISLGTIYRTLEILRATGLVQVFSFGGSAARYEAAIDKHHHLLCTRCRQLINVQADGITDIAREVASKRGFSDIDYSLTVVGCCLECTQKSANGMAETQS